MNIYIMLLSQLCSDGWEFDPMCDQEEDTLLIHRGYNETIQVWMLPIIADYVFNKSKLPSLEYIKSVKTLLE